MEKPRGTFAPHWLAMTILDDKKSLANVESFMEPKGKIPKHLHGRLIVVNDTTNEEHLCADRYSSIIVFLASHWSITNCRFRLVGYQYVDQKRVDTTIPTSSLESMGKPSLFMQALQMGEEAWRRKKDKENAQRMYHDEEPSPRGHYELVLVSEEEPH